MNTLKAIIWFWIFSAGGFGASWGIWKLLNPVDIMTWMYIALPLFISGAGYGTFITRCVIRDVMLKELKELGGKND